MADSPIENVLSRLEGIVPSGSTGKQWSCLCPAHEDSHQSLSVGVTDSNIVLMRCFSGCDLKSILSKIGLEKKDLFPDKIERELAPGVTVGLLALEKRLPADFLSKVIGLKNCKHKKRGEHKEKDAVLIPVLDESGAELFSRKRLDLIATKGGSWQPPETDVKSYGKWRLPRYRRSGTTLIIVEGETDSWTLWLFDYPALGIPGNNNVEKCLEPSDLKGFFTFYVFKDSKKSTKDKSGENFVEEVGNKILSHIKNPNIFVISSSEPDVKDPNDLLKKYGDLKFKSRFEELISAAIPFVPKTPGEKKTEDEESASETFPFTDYGNAERLVDKYGNIIRFAQDRWFIWDGTRWQDDETQQILGLAKKIVRSIPSELTDDMGKDEKKMLFSHALRSESGRALRETAKLSESEPGVAIKLCDLDTNHFFLNCQNGILDLKTGEVVERSSSHLITKICPVIFDKEAKCPTWMNFMSRVFSNDVSDASDTGNQEIISYMSRLMGYCLTGDISGQILPIFWGNGSNGKSVLLNIIRKLLGKGYAVKAPRGLLMAKKMESHPTELTVLLGARLAIATETSRNQHLSEDLVKDLTGDEAITARHMREDFFEFEPTHKLILCTNHRPKIVQNDDGIWRRVILIEFRTKFWNPDLLEVGPDHLRRDDFLKDKLMEELPGILNWCIQGCLDWQKNGFQVPKSIVDDTRKYRKDEDLISQYLEARCNRGFGYGDTVFSDVYDDYCRWCESVLKSRPTWRNAFSGDLDNKGVKMREKGKNIKYCLELELVKEETVTSIKDLD